jgi:osmotically-inducible protein OsmY
MGGLTGAAIAHFFDPDLGRGRRTRLRDQGLAAVRRLGDRAQARARYRAHQAEGELRERFQPGPQHPFPDDRTLEQRIQSEVFGDPDVPKDRLALDVVDGEAVLRGELDSEAEMRALVQRVSEVAGVRRVQNLLHLPGQPAPNKEEALEASERAEKGGGS